MYALMDCLNSLVSLYSDIWNLTISKNMLLYGQQLVHLSLDADFIKFLLPVSCPNLTSVSPNNSPLYLI